jgi:hypothetical protein
MRLGNRDDGPNEQVNGQAIHHRVNREKPEIKVNDKEINSKSTRYYAFSF